MVNQLDYIKLMLCSCYIMLINGESVGLYKDNGLGVLWNFSGPQAECKRKSIVKAFKHCGLRITIQANLWIVNFLDIQHNLDTSTYQPYWKPDNNPVYLNPVYQPPRNLLEQLPKSIGKHMSNISNKYVFRQSVSMYQVALRKNGFSEQLKCIASDNNRENSTKEKKLCKRKSFGSIHHIQWM